MTFYGSFKQMLCHTSRVTAGRRFHVRAACCGAVLALSLICAAYTHVGRLDGIAGFTQSAPSYQVVFDRSRDQLTAPFNTGFEGMSHLTVLLRRAGAAVSLNYIPLPDLLPGLAGTGCVLVLGIPWNMSYTAADLAAIRAFLVSGGGVLVIAEHDNIYGNATVQNLLTRPYGITVQPDQALARTGPEAHFTDAMWPVCRVSRWGMNEVQFLLAAPLAVKPPAEALAELVNPRDGRTVVAAWRRVQRGCMAVIADYEILWNMTSRTGIHAGDNAAFIMGVFELLAGTDRHEHRGQVRAPTPERWRSGRKTAVFVTAGMSRYPCCSVNGFDDFADTLNKSGYAIVSGQAHVKSGREIDLTIVGVPLERLSYPRAYAGAKKLLLIGSGRTNLLHAEPALRRAVETVDSVPDTYPYPLNAIADRYGIRFFPVTLIDVKTAALAARGSWPGGGSFRLFSCGALELSPAVRHAVTCIAAQGAGTLAAENLFPLTEQLGVTPDRTIQKIAFSGCGGGPCPVVVKNTRLMAVSDAALLTRQGLRTPGGRRLMQEILSWLAEK